MGWDMGWHSVPPAARTSSKLTARHAQNLKKPGYHGDGSGLYLRVATGGSKSWLFRYTKAQRTRDMGLGSFPAVSLAAAREAAHRCRQKLALGVDPISARNADRLAASVTAAEQMTFKRCGEAYVAAHDASWSNPKHRAQWRATLARYVYPVLGSVPVRSIDTALVLKILEPIWVEKTETASRVRGRIETILNWARARGFRDGENPARWRGHLDQLLPAKTKIHRVTHHSALPYREIGVFMALLSQHSAVSARALEFLVLTAARTGEALGARWSEINLEDRVWIIPAERMKARRAHRVPLTAVAATIVQAMTEFRRDDFVFPGAKADRPLSQMALLMLLRRMGYAHVTTHGFRSTFRDWAAECSAHSREVAEMALAHTVADRVEAAYLRSDLFERRRELMDAWASFCRNSAIGSVE
jgi:integrase